jgi:hypothetical protein
MIGFAGGEQLDRGDGGERQPLRQKLREDRRCQDGVQHSDHVQVPTTNTTEIEDCEQYCRFEK